MAFRPILIRAAVFIAFVGSVLVATSSPADASNAIVPGNTPTPLPGLTNGELPQRVLINVAPGCQAYRGAATSLSLLLASAHERGIAVGTEQCYRALSDQVSEVQDWTTAGNSACAAPVVTSPSGTVQGTSMHGWGKAVDFTINTFEDPAYTYLRSAAGIYGWNHPGWAEPGGSACPEPWHFEWDGDGGTLGATPIVADVIGLIPSPDNRGYATVTGLGALHTAGDAVSHGDASAIALNWVLVGVAPTPDRMGYWMVGADGGVFSFGDARFYGSTGSMVLNQPVVGMAPTPDGKGYWEVASDGGIFSFGDARFYGSTASMHLNRPIVGMAATPDGKGYWLVASDGGIFSFGDAKFYGSTGSLRLNQPVTGMAATQSGDGYWMVAADGGLFNFGDAPFLGSSGATPPVQPVVSITPTSSGAGYWMTDANAKVLAFGDANTR